jgi:Bacterial Alpha-2-macroglobulin MG10 domain
VQFQTDFDRGRYEYTYILKIVTPGKFRAMPAQMTAMYVPDAFATTGAQTVDVLSPDPAAATPSSQAAGAGAAPSTSKAAGGVQ